MTDEAAPPPAPPAPKKKRKPGPHSRAKLRELKAEIAAREAEIARLKNAPVAAPPPPAKEPPLESVVQLGAPPADPMEAQAWAYRAVLFTMHGAMTDDKLSERDRRKIVVQLGGTLTKLMPDARRWETERLIREDRAAIERKAKASGAKLEPRPPKRKPPAP